jgi:hypothetical protein
VSKLKARSGTFIDNTKLPIYRWFRYSAGFSADWVKAEIISYEEESGQKAIILDPFVGSGTTAFASCSLGNQSYGFDGHPFIARIAQAKNMWHLDEKKYLDACQSVIENAKRSSVVTSRHDEKNLLGKCYDLDTLTDLDKLRSAYESLQSNDDPIWELIRLNITSILRVCSKAGTAQWQYVLPNKSKTKVLNAFNAFLGKAELMASDMKRVKCEGWTNAAQIYSQDVRVSIDSPKCNLLITSPPYPNNYDYADATRLEMMFWGEIDGWGDLKSVIRPTIIRSCSQHSAGDKIILDEILQEPLLEPILKELAPTTSELKEIRLTKGGKKTYHTMIAAYFLDLAKIWKNTRKVMSKDSRICFVIGDSAPYGVYVPAEKWLGDLAIAAGFKSYKFEKLRDRNIKWKNRKHTVPLHEGRLWING